MKIDEIIEQVRSSHGVERTTQVVLNEYEQGERCFLKIADAMVDTKPIDFDRETITKEIEVLIDWLYQMDRVKIDYRKGILFKGDVGRGKTFLMKVFKHFMQVDKHRYRSGDKELSMNLIIVNAKKIAGEYQDAENGGYRVIERYANTPVLCIDDIGAEGISMQYGNKINVVAEIIDLREERSRITFGTTNVEILSKNYDDRTISRMYSLFNIVVINHQKDYRKEK